MRRLMRSVQRARRCGQVGSLAGFVLGLERRHDGLGHGNQLFLALRVREAAPFVHFAQFTDARRDLLLQRAQVCDGLIDFL